MRNDLPTINAHLTTLLNRSVYVVCLLLFLAFNSYAQSDGQTIPQRGFQPTDSYALGNIETINTMNGNLMLNIPLASLPAGRGGNPGFQLRLRYNSKIWDGQADVAPNPNNPNQSVNVTWLLPSDQGGWDYNLRRYVLSIYNRNDGGVYYPPPDLRNTNIWKLKVAFPDGGMHEFRPYGYDDQCDDSYFTVLPSPGMSYYSIDGTFARLDFSQSGWTLSFADGTRVVNQSAWQRSYDRNGNYTEIQDVADYQNTGHSATLVIDELGRTIAVEHGSGEDYVHVSGVNGVPVTTTVKWSNTWIKKTYRAGNHFQYDVDLHNGVPGVSEILLPSQLGTNLKYSFGYNGWSTSGHTTPSVGWGELSSVTMPSGARADYQYEMDNKSGPLWQANWVLKNAPTQKELNYNLEYDGSVTPAPTERWIYHISDTFALIGLPDGGGTKEWFTNPDFPGGGLVYKTEQADGSVVERIWKENRPYLPPGVTIPANVKVNPYVNKEFVSIRDAAGTLVKTAIREYRPDKNGNRLQESEYDWVPYSSVVRDGEGKPIDVIPTGAVLLRTNTSTYHCATPDASDTTTNDPDTYDKVTAPALRNLPASTEIGNGSQTIARSEFFYGDNALTTGNLIEQKSWDSSKGQYSNPLSTGNSISVSHQYDTYGNRTLTADPLGHQTKLTYGSIGGFTDLYPTQIISAFGTSIQRTITQECDFDTGLVTRTTDVDNNVTSETDYDAMGRLVEIRAAANVPSLKAVTRVEYSAVDRRVMTRSDLSVPYDGKLVSIQHYDQLGRIRLARQLEDSATQDPNDETQGIKVQTRYRYSGANSYRVSSNPYREASSSQAPSVTMGWSRMKADNNGRLMESQQFSGNTLPAPWSGNTTGIGQVISTYDANTTIVMDQAGKVRRSLTDGLGRLVRVDEPDQNNNLDVGGAPFQSTSYSYDALDNLTTVTQGTQTRTFSYDSLKRLKSATNPESGFICYGIVVSGQCQTNGYDASGNLIYKTDARLVQTTYAYDQLNRNTSVSYSNDPQNTPTVTRTYDGATNGVGRLWKTETSGSSGSRTTIESYDVLGQPTNQSQQFYSGGVWSAPYTVSATYDKAGHVLTETYPSGHTVNYAYDNAGRTSGFSGNLGEGVPRTYASDFQYAESGGIRQEKFGTDTPLYHKQRYNVRGQLWDMRLSTVSFTADPANGDRGSLVNYYSDDFAPGGSGIHNNGNLLRQDINIPGSGFFQDNFSYDSLNRLTSISENLNGGNETFKQAYTFDRWGNRTIDPSHTTVNVPHPEYTVDVANNRLVAPAGYTHEYDAAGNQTRDTYTTNSPTAGYRTYDAENRIVAAQKPVTGKVSWAYYNYNGDGQRVRRKIATFEIWQVYGFGGELLAEYPQNGSSLAIAQPQKEYGYRNGQLLVTAEPFINAAWNQPATQTDNLNGTTTAAKAVDGDVDGDLAEGHTSSATASNLNSWWQVDLQSVQTISSITVWGRTDCCPEMTSDFHVFVSDNPFTSTSLSATQAQSGVNDYQHFGFSGPSSSTGPTSINVNRPGRYVRVQLSGTGSLALGEVQIWSAAAKVEWLVTDQLGTPRMAVDKTGSLAGVSRHDYLPFGEELSVGRSITPGYNTSDYVRQKFTSKERDSETALDYFGARYHSSMQARFTSPDPLMASASTTDPQSFNRYSYVQNRPLVSIDPSGMYDCEIGKTCSFTTNDWATNGVHPEQGLIQESVTIDIQTTPVTTSGFDPDAVTLNLKDLASPVLADQYVPTPGTMPNAGGHDTPDRQNFVQMSAGGEFMGIGLDLTATYDEFGNWYLGGGPSLGVAWPISASVVSGTTYDENGFPTYDENSVRDILTGPSTGVTAGAGIVGSSSWNNPLIGGILPIPLVPGGGSTKAIGVGPPQISINETWALRIPGFRWKPGGSE